MKSRFAKQLWISFGAIVLSIIAASGALFYFAGDIDSQVEKISNDRLLAAESVAALGVLAQLEKDAPDAAKYAAAMDALVPTHDNLIGVPAWISTIAAKDRVTASLSFLGNNTPASVSSPGTDGFSLVVDGALPDISTFIDDLESNSPQFLLSIGSVDLVSNGGSYRLTSQGMVFSRPAQNQ